MGASKEQMQSLYDALAKGDRQAAGTLADSINPTLHELLDRNPNAVMRTAAGLLGDPDRPAREVQWQDAAPEADTGKFPYQDAITANVQALGKAAPVAASLAGGLLAERGAAKLAGPLLAKLATNPKARVLATRAIQGIAGALGGAAPEAIREGSTDPLTSPLTMAAAAAPVGGAVVRRLIPGMGGALREAGKMGGELAKFSGAADPAVAALTPARTVAESGMTLAPFKPTLTPAMRKELVAMGVPAKALQRLNPKKAAALVEELQAMKQQIGMGERSALMPPPPVVPPAPVAAPVAPPMAAAAGPAPGDGVLQGLRERLFPSVLSPEARAQMAQMAETGTPGGAPGGIAQALANTPPVGNPGTTGVTQAAAGLRAPGDTAPLTAQQAAQAAAQANAAARATNAAPGAGLPADMRQFLEAQGIPAAQLDALSPQDAQALIGQVQQLMPGRPLEGLLEASLAGRTAPGAAAPVAASPAAAEPLGGLGGAGGGGAPPAAAVPAAAAPAAPAAALTPETLQPQQVQDLVGDVLNHVDMLQGNAPPMAAAVGQGGGDASLLTPFTAPSGPRKIGRRSKVR